MLTFYTKFVNIGAPVLVEPTSYMSLLLCFFNHVAYLSKYVFQAKQMVHKDNRLRMVNEILNGIKVCLLSQL